MRTRNVEHDIRAATCKLGFNKKEQSSAPVIFLFQKGRLIVDTTCKELKAQFNCAVKAFLLKIVKNNFNVHIFAEILITTI